MWGSCDRPGCGTSCFVLFYVAHCVPTVGSLRDKQLDGFLLLLSHLHRTPASPVWIAASTSWTAPSFTSLLCRTTLSSYPKEVSAPGSNATFICITSPIHNQSHLQAHGAGLDQRRRPPGGFISPCRLCSGYLTRKGGGLVAS